VIEHDPPWNCRCRSTEELRFSKEGFQRWIFCSQESLKPVAEGARIVSANMRRVSQLAMQIIKDFRSRPSRSLLWAGLLGVTHRADAPKLETPSAWLADDYRGKTVVKTKTVGQTNNIIDRLASAPQCGDRP
jgi:hypothetical protein